MLAIQVIPFPPLFPGLIDSNPKNIHKTVHTLVIDLGKNKEEVSPHEYIESIKMYYIYCTVVVEIGTLSNYPYC